ncbi:MAG: M28 family peptidase, partial [Candidatus Thorarchaeota archaeon]
MRTILLAILLMTLLFMPVGAIDKTNPSSDSSPAQDSEDSSYLQRVYAANLARNIYSAVSVEGYQDYVREFTENGSRWILDYTAALVGINMEARNYLLSKMFELSDGRMETEVVGNHLNVVGKLPGYLPGNNPAIVIAGHYDSWYISIGANEGASGIATILELIEPLSAYEWPLDIYFIAINARYAQWGPFGSAEVSRYFLNEEIDVMALYCVEALLVEDPNALSDERVFMTYLDMGESNYHMSQYWAELGRVMSMNHGQNMIKPLPSYNLSVWGSNWYDHNHFFDGGYINLIVPFESGYDYDDAYRTPADTWVNTDYRYQLGAEVTGAIGASIAYTMSREYGQPMHHDLSTEIWIGRS